MLQKYTKEWLEELCQSSITYAQVLEKAGRKQSGGNQSYLKSLIEKYNIDISHFKGQGWAKGTHNTGYNKYNIEDIFVENSNIPRREARRYILKFDLIPYQCAWCGNKGEWRGQPMALELDHINGINNDHRLSNLRFLCPNCHAITPTYAGKNNKET